MSQSSELSNPRLEHLLHSLIEHRKLWLFPGIAALMVSWIYVYFVRAETYTARQTLIVRDDLLGQSLKPGQFDSLDLMKSAQETILEIARKPQVVRNAMRKIGPSRTSWFGVSDSWPSDKIIEEVQGSISLSAPNGAEFGHTETVVLSTKSSSRERAAAFVLALLEEINVKINEVRDLRLRSMKNELTIIRDSARESLSDSADRLIAMERAIGPDLPTLRSLSDPQSGEGAMSQTLLQIRSERRQFENQLHSARNQRETLVAATHDPNAILATSDELFRFQPALSRLKQELIEAQSALAESIGRYEQVHPEVQKHQEQVRSMHRQIHEELDSAKRGLESQIASLEQKVAKSREQEGDIDARFNRISSKRVDYLRLDEEVKKKTEVFNEAQGNLASIQRLDSKQFDVTLLTPVDEPQVSTRADGLGRTTTILGSGLLGFLAGFGLVLLLSPGPDEDPTLTGGPRKNSPPKTPAPQPINDQPQVPPGGHPGKLPGGVPIPPVVGHPTITPELTSPTAEAPASVNGQQTTPTPPATVGEQNSPATFGNAPTQAQPQAQPTTAATADPEVKAEAINRKFPSRTEAIQAEINRAVEESASSIPVPEAPAAVAPATTPIQASQSQSVVAESNTGVAKNADSTRKNSDSTGVPTAASILAALDKVSPSAGKTAETVIKPQQLSSSDASATPGQAVKPIQTVAEFKAFAEQQASTEPDSSTSGAIQIEPSNSNPTPDGKQIELRRRVNNQRPVDIAKETQPIANDQNTPRVSLELDVATETGPDANSVTVAEARGSHASNPFLNPGSSNSASDATSGLAQRMLEEARDEAAKKGLVAPVVPVKSSEETTSTGRAPESTVPIPDQIKQLTDSIASFAKPINRVKDSGKNTDF